MREPLKILPAVMVTCATLFAAKAIGIWSDFRTELVGLRPAYAAASKSDSHEEEPQAAQTHEADNHDADDAYDSYDSNTKHEGENSRQMKAPMPSDLIPTSLMSASEVDVLESLSERRQLLDKRERELDMREKLIVATEAKVDRRIEDLKVIEVRLMDLLGQLDAEKAQQTESLIKVYEAMKAKDAARIFENLNTDILIEVASGMKEAKVAAIMAAMDAQKAQQLTVLLASRLNIPNNEEIERLRNDRQTDG